MNFFKLVLLLVVALVLVAGPVVQVQAADGTGQEVANQAEGWLVAVLYIVGIVLALAGLVFLLAVGRKYYSRLAQLLPKIDANPLVLGFGNSIPGRALNDGLTRLQSYVDEPTDPFIQRIEMTKAFKKAHELGLIDGETFSKLAGSAVADAIKLTNGVPDVAFSLLGFDSTQGAKG